VKRSGTLGQNDKRTISPVGAAEPSNVFIFRDLRKLRTGQATNAPCPIHFTFFVKWVGNLKIDPTGTVNLPYSASQAIAATATPISRLIRSLMAKITGSSLSSPREASSQTRHNHKSIKGMISHSRPGSW